MGAITINRTDEISQEDLHNLTIFFNEKTISKTFEKAVRYILYESSVRIKQLEKEVYELDKKAAKISELGFKGSWKNIWEYRNGVIEPIYINKHTIKRLNKLAKELNYTNYSDLLEFLTTNFSMEKQNLLNQITNKSTIEKTFIAFLETIKKLIENEILLLKKRTN